MKSGGTLLVICGGRDEGSAPGALPWALTRSEIEAIGLDVERFEDFMDEEAPPVRRFRITLRKP